MGQCLSSRERQGESEASNVPEVEECSFGDLVNMGYERVSGVKDDTKVADMLRRG